MLLFFYFSTIPSSLVRIFVHLHSIKSFYKVFDRQRPDYSFYETLNLICIYELNLQNHNSSRTLCGSSFAHQSGENLPQPPPLSQHPNAHHEDYQQFFSSGSLTETLSTPSSHCLSAACITDFPSLTPCCCTQRLRDKDGNFPHRCF